MSTTPPDIQRNRLCKFEIIIQFFLNLQIFKLVTDRSLPHDLFRLANGRVRRKLAGFLLLAWLIVFSVPIKGVKSLDKTVWFIALFPYLILSILLCFGLSLDGAMDGIKYYVTPNMFRLCDIQVYIYSGMCQCGISPSVPRCGQMPPYRYSSLLALAGAH